MYIKVFKILIFISCIINRFSYAVDIDSVDLLTDSRDPYITQIQCVSARVQIKDALPSTHVTYGLYKENGNDSSLVQTGDIPNDGAVVSYCDEDLSEGSRSSSIGEYILAQGYVNQKIKFKLVFDGIGVRDSGLKLASGIDFNLDIQDASIDHIRATGLIKYPPIFSITSPRVLHFTTADSSNKNRALISDRIVFRKTFIVGDVTVPAQVPILMSTNTKVLSTDLLNNDDVSNKDNTEVAKHYYYFNHLSDFNYHDYSRSYDEMFSSLGDYNCITSTIDGYLFSVCLGGRIQYTLNIFPYAQFCNYNWIGEESFINGYHLELNNSDGTASCHDGIRPSLYPEGSYWTTCPRQFIYGYNNLHAACYTGEVQEYSQVMHGNDVNLRDVQIRHYGRINFSNEKGILTAH